MKEILDRGERNEKRELLSLLMEGIDSNILKLRHDIMAMLSGNCERIGIYAFDLINIKCHIKLVKLLSVRNPMEYPEEFLCNMTLVLSKCIQDMNVLIIEDFKKEDKLISWKKVINILKHFMTSNKGEGLKLACCRIFYLLVKHEYYDDLVRVS